MNLILIDSNMILNELPSLPDVDFWRGYYAYKQGRFALSKRFLYKNANTLIRGTNFNLGWEYAQKENLHLLRNHIVMELLNNQTLFNE